MNQQPPEKKSRSANLQVHSIFNTIQGEGPFCGTPAIFIRLAGCNLQCPLCDTDYTSNRVEFNPSEIQDFVKSLGELHGLPNPRNRLVVITGGEPFRQNLTPLLSELVGQGYFVQIETNGTLPPSEYYYSLDVQERRGVYVVCSPKTGSINKKTLRVACCLKYVMSHLSVGEDGLPLTALDHTAEPRLARPPANWDRPIYLQPVDWTTSGASREEVQHLNELSLQSCIHSCRKNNYILQLQIHKLIGVP